MATNFEDIYKIFISSIDSYELADYNEEQLYRYFEQLLMSAIADCMQIQPNRRLEEYDIEEKVFVEDLKHTEKVALARAMKLAWVSDKLYSEELMRKNIGDRDYKAEQGTDYLRRLSELDTKLRKEIEQLLIDYSYTQEESAGGLW
ncbi:hypothetical protein [Enterococcus cecorum]|uniref:hypothetical protein n=1 Tax=Enterococcus cecorum TaxID=44008 RepID=UPI00148C42F1|nr:hypothetical protein [Enterococcus cecorum]